jgi:predicted transport protein
MPLYRDVEGKLAQIQQQPLAKEKELQQLVEANSLELLDVFVLESEYSTTSGGRIDTLGVDRNGAPVIIEYKKNQNDNVINQALSYRKWLTAQKPEFFEMLIRKRLSNDIATLINPDWKRPRIICIAENFSKFDIDTADVLLPVFRVELMKYRIYEGGIFHLEALQTATERQTDSISTSSKASIDEPGSKEVTVDAHRSHGSPAIQAVFDDLRSRILALGPQVREFAVGAYVGYSLSKNFAEIHIQKSRLKLNLRGITNDPQGRALKVPDERGWTLNYEISFSSEADLDYIMDLIGQSYSDVT